MNMVKELPIAPPLALLTLTVKRGGVFTSKDRIAWYTDMRAREAAEAKLREENVPSSVDLDAVDRQATPAPSVVIDERRENSSRKVRRLGIAGLFSDENET